MTTVTIQTMYDEMRSTWEELKGVIDVQEKEVKSLGGTTQETKTHIDKLNDRITSLETAMARPQLHSTVQETPGKSEAKAAFVQALKGGYGSLTQEQKQFVPLAGPGEAKTLFQTDDTTGGYAAGFNLYKKNGIVETLAA